MAHRYGDERIVEWLNSHTYHPRSNKHGSAACQFLVDDMLSESEPIQAAAESGAIVYQEDYTVGERALRWNVDLIIGPPEEGTAEDTRERAMARGTPEEIWLAVDAKSVMTEHAKARKNRQRDINSFADIMYRHHANAITGGLLLINAAEKFESPLREPDDITTHKNIRRLTQETVDLFREVDRSDSEVNGNIDAVGCVVVQHTNLGDETVLLTDPPAPAEGDAVHYRMFLNTLVHLFEERFL